MTQTQFTIKDQITTWDFSVTIDESFQWDLEINKMSDESWQLNVKNFGIEDTHYYIVYLTNLIRNEGVSDLRCNVDDTIIEIVNGLKG